MPFDVAPRVKTRFQEFADAMLRGCAVTAPCNAITNGDGAVCAWGAMLVGLGRLDPYSQLPADYEDRPDEAAVGDAYRTRYGTGIADDNDSGAFTREEIAARIAAL